MPKTKTTMPSETREKGQRSLSVPLYLDRQIPGLYSREWLDADLWRKIVSRQPVATICRDTLISNIMALEWQVEPRDSKMRDEYKSEIEYYTRFFQYTGEYDYAELVEWISTDLLDIPFGGAAELGRSPDTASGKLVWVEPLDGGTLFPTGNKNFPVGQQLKEYATNTVYFPAHAINRVYLSPRTNIKRKGWGVAPPEKIYLGLELLNRGDYYYASLLLDTPAAGILDLGDMDKQSAEEWVQAWRDLLGGIDPFKIPVLYQHNQKADFIQFGKSPTELMFDKATMKYAAIVAAGYGMSLSDIGFQSVSSGGDTLAGGIRQERRTKRTGFAVLKKKLTAFFNRMLPEYLMFNYIDLDDEASVAMGRARLADATAAAQYIDKRIFSPAEMRRQAIADGLITIPVSEDMPSDDEFPDVTTGKSAERPTMLGRPVAVSAGGQGEVLQSAFDIMRTDFASVSSMDIKKIIRAVIPHINVELSNLSSGDLLEDDGLLSWNEWHDEVIWGNIIDDIPELTDVCIKSSISSGSSSVALDKLLEHAHRPAEIADIISNGVYYDLLMSGDEQHGLKLQELNNVITRFSAQARTEIAKFYSAYPSIVVKSVISGTRKFMSIKRSSGELDVDDPINVAESEVYVRDVLVYIIDILLFELRESISGIISSILGDEKWLDEREDDLDDNHNLQEM